MNATSIYTNCSNSIPLSSKLNSHPKMLVNKSIKFDSDWIQFYAIPSNSILYVIFGCKSNWNCHESSFKPKTFDHSIISCSCYVKQLILRWIAHSWRDFFSFSKDLIKNSMVFELLNTSELIWCRKISKFCYQMRFIKTLRATRRANHPSGFDVIGDFFSSSSSLFNDLIV